MRGYNRITIMGNLTRDPDVRFTPNKQKVARITVAVGRQWKNKATGAQESHTDFINVVAWSFTADICERYLKKGQPVLIEGRLSVRNYDDPKSGQKRIISEVVADSIILLGGGKGENSDDSQRKSKQETSGYAGYNTQQPSVDEFPLDFSELDNDAPDEDIPF